jgi:hypothetical protein
MTDDVRDLAARFQREERERIGFLPTSPPPPSEPLTIHHTDLAEALPGSPIATEWNFYRREVARLLAEGNEGKWVLIKNEEVIGLWATQEEADRVRLQRFLMQPVLMKQVLTREPVLRGGGYGRPWRS